MGVKISMKGITDVLKGFDRDKELVKKAKPAIVDEVSEVVVKSAKRRVPVLTGNLKSKIYKRKVGRGTQVIADTDYAASVEFGSVHNRAKPYMTPAVADGEKALEGIVDKHLKNLGK